MVAPGKLDEFANSVIASVAKQPRPCNGLIHQDCFVAPLLAKTAKNIFLRVVAVCYEGNCKRSPANLAMQGFYPRLLRLASAMAISPWNHYKKQWAKTNTAHRQQQGPCR